MSSKNNFVFNALKGMGMGIAEVIPGVSGGTIAFITGIYETLLNSIKAFSLALLTDFKNGGFKAVWSKINGNFLVSLMSGMVLGFLVGLFLIGYLLENHPVLVWSFFFGLIIASAVYVAKQITKWRVIEIIGLVIGAIFAYFITIATPASGSENLLYVFVCGIIAISALILPGLSGSFMLLLLGMYQFILHDSLKEGLLKNFNTDSLLVVSVFGLGCIIGLTTFARLLSWTFKNYKNTTLAVLTGFMIGSLNKIWPWRKGILGMDESGKLVEIVKGMEVDKIIKEVNLLPAQYGLEVGSPHVLGAIACMLIGFVMVFALEKLGFE